MCMVNSHAGLAAPVNMAIDNNRVLYLDILAPGMAREDLKVSCDGRELVIKHRAYDETLAKMNADGGPDGADTGSMAKIELVCGWVSGPFMLALELQVQSRVRACALKDGILSLEVEPFEDPKHVVEIQ